MSAGIRVRSYRVGFGDCFLVSFPDRTKTRHMLIDFGNAPGKGSSNRDFPAIARNIRDETGGHLDVVVVTHEHLDHMEGFRSQRKIFAAMTIDYVWMSLPSHPDYYRDYPNAEPLRRLRALAHDYHRALVSNGIRMAASFETLLRNNLSNVERLEYVRSLPREDVLYLARSNRRKTMKPFSRAIGVRVLAPEKDVSVYYGGPSNALTAASASVSSALDDGTMPAAFRGAATVETPANLGAGDWRRLRTRIQTGGASGIRMLDRAANDTSLVFVLEVAGKRLLFTGDAEHDSWATMRKKASRHLLKPVDFLKVSHHGSRNGTPRALLDAILPVARKDHAQVMVSTRSKIYGTVNPVPDADLQRDLRRRCKKLVTTDDLGAHWVDIEL